MPHTEKITELIIRYILKVDNESMYDLWTKNFNKMKTLLLIAFAISFVGFIYCIVLLFNILTNTKGRKKTTLSVNR